MRRKGSFTPSTGEPDVLKNVYDQKVTANCEEMFAEMSTKRAHLECRYSELCTNKGPHIYHRQSVQTLQIQDDAVDIAGLEKSTEL